MNTTLPAYARESKEDAPEHNALVVEESILHGETMLFSGGHGGIVSFAENILNCCDIGAFAVALGFGLIGHNGGNIHQGCDGTDDSEGQLGRG